MQRTAVMLDTLLLETVFADAKLMLLGLEMNQFVRVSFHSQTLPWKFVTETRTQISNSDT